MWLLVVTFVAINATPPGVLMAPYNSVIECHEAGGGQGR